MRRRGRVRAQTDAGAGALFDKTVSSKPLAFAADAAPMGIEWRFDTGGTGWSAPLKRMDRAFEKVIVGGTAGR